MAKAGIFDGLVKAAESIATHFRSKTSGAASTTSDEVFEVGSKTFDLQFECDVLASALSSNFENKSTSALLSAFGDLHSKLGKIESRTVGVVNKLQGINGKTLDSHDERRIGNDLSALDDSMKEIPEALVRFREFVDAKVATIKAATPETVEHMVAEGMASGVFPFKEIDSSRVLKSATEAFNAFDEGLQKIARDDFAQRVSKSTHDQNNLLSAAETLIKEVEQTIAASAKDIASAAPQFYKTQPPTQDGGASLDVA